MKKLDYKSVLIGGLITFIGVSMMSSTSPEGNENELEFVSHPLGMSVFNENTNTLYMYIMAKGKMKDKPYQVLKVSKDGSSFEEMK